MKRRGWAVLGFCLLIASLGGGCACVDSCCTSSCDFGGCGCTELCGSQSQPVVDSLCDLSMDMQSHGGCGGACGASCGGGNGCLLSCSNWGRREFFVDGCGKPCYGPIASIAMMFRDSLKSCGCGPLYVDEWISDPPLCRDPCGSGCSALGECGYYAGSPLIGGGSGCGCGGGGLLRGHAGCSSGGCTGGCSAGGPSCTAPTIPEVVEPSCGCAASVEPTCGCTAACEPSCGCETASCTSCTGCGCEASCGCVAGNQSCIGCGRLVKATAESVNCKISDKVEHFLAERKYKWSERARARNCNGGTCGEYVNDIEDYRFDTPEQFTSGKAAAGCQCADCRSRLKATLKPKEPSRFALSKPSKRKSNIRQVSYVCDCPKCRGKVRAANGIR